MTFYVENDTSEIFDFSVDEIGKQIMEEVLEREGCPYEAQVNVLLTDNSRIHQYNLAYRNVDRPTDVLSFPNVSYNAPADFSSIEEYAADYCDMESGELILGDIVISVEKAKEQAEKYGHSLKREVAFLMAHSMLHLCGYDHMTASEAAVMEEKQENVLCTIGITRD